MSTLLLLRHAKSSWENEDLDDHDRPLNGRGKRDAPRMGQLIVQQDLVPDIILTSTAKRARTTADAVAEQCGCEDSVRAYRDLYHASSHEFIEKLNELPDDVGRVLLVGHNPGMESFIELLTGQSEAMPTAALAQIELPIERWQGMSPDTRGTLVNLWRPRDLA